MAKLDNCERKDELISYLYEELAPNALLAFQRHLAECRSCQQEATEFGQTRNMLQAWEVPAAPPLDYPNFSTDNLPNSTDLPKLDVASNRKMATNVAATSDPTNLKSCGQKADLISYLYNELDAAQQPIFSQHLQDCASCQQEATEFRRLQPQMQAWTVPTNNRVDLDFAAHQPYTLRRILTDLANILPAWFKYSAAFATACSLLLITMAALQTEVQWNQQGFRLQLGILGSKESNVNLSATPATVATVDEAVVREMVANAITEKQAKLVQDLEEKRSQIVAQLERQIALLSNEISEKNNSQFTRATLELRRKTREELERALLELQQNRGNDNLDDPFNFMGSIDWSERPTTTGSSEGNSKNYNVPEMRRLGKD
jgi:anti-sigma factor RsiW